MSKDKNNGDMSKFEEILFYLEKGFLTISFGIVCIIIFIFIYSAVTYKNPTTRTDKNPTTRTEYVPAKPIKSASKYDFRKVKWGMVTDEVITSEYRDSPDWKFTELGTSKYILFPKATQVLCYRGELYNASCLLIYHFKNNKLFAASYLFHHRTDYETAAVYASIGTDLVYKLGKKGKAVDEKQTQWIKDDRTAIRLVLQHNYDIQLVYLSLQYAPKQGFVRGF